MHDACAQEEESPREDLLGWATDFDDKAAAEKEKARKAKEKAAKKHVLNIYELNSHVLLPWLLLPGRRRRRSLS